MHSLSPGSFVKEDVLVTKKWRQAQVLADQISNRWLKEYIPSLQERQKRQKPCQKADIVDLVLLVDECLPRGQWYMGRVTRVVHSRYGLVRTVEVKTGTFVINATHSETLLIGRVWKSLPKLNTV